MSIVNVWMEHGRGLIAVDTRAENDTRHMGGQYVHHEAAKLVPFPHANMVLANRGDLAFFQMFVSTVLLEPVSWNLDMFADRAAAICDDLYRVRMEVAAPAYDGRPFETEIFAVGWSDKLKEVVCFLCERGTGDAEFKVSRIDAWCASPQAWDVWPDAASVPRFSNIETMIPVAREQVRYFRAQHPGRPIGGHLITAIVTRWGIDIRPATDLG